MAHERGSAGFVMEARDLGFAYGGHRVLDGVSLRVEPGEVVGLLGPNGSGKSTVIKLLSGVMSGFQGDIELAGRPLAGWHRRDLARRLAVVQQEPRFGFPFSALEVVLMGRHPHLGAFAYESEADTALAREALALCGADHLADRIVTELSSGERQRVVCARALAQNPEAMLLDEPASFMDVRFQIALYDLIVDLARNRGLGFLLVLHDINLAAEVCDRLYLLHRGHVFCSGTPAEVITTERLATVFDAPLSVVRHPLTGGPLVLARSGRTRPSVEASGLDKK